MLGSSIPRPRTCAAVCLAVGVTAGLLASAAPAAAQARNTTRTTALTVTGVTPGASYAGFAVGPLMGTASFTTTPGMPGQAQAVSLICVDFLHAAYLGETFTANVSAIATTPSALALTRHADGLAGYRKAVWLADQFAHQPVATWGGIQSAIWKIFGSGSLDGNAVTQGGAAVAADRRNEVYWTAQADAFATSAAFRTYDYGRYAVYTDVNAPRGGRQEFLGPGVVTAAAVVPEPGTLALAGLGAVGVVGWGVRRRRGA